MNLSAIRRVASVAFALTLGCGFSTGENPNNPGGNSQTTTTAQSQCRQSCSSGCCTTTGECIAGTAETACGASGNACQACPTNQRCEASAGGGACRPCSQLNCNGCCSSAGQCQAGTEDTACGNAGQTCTSCPGVCAPYSLGGGRCQ